MIVSWNWLTEYIRLDISVETLTERLALAGLNHESTADVGGDLAIDLEVTSNRPDCNSHLGVARELFVLFGNPVREPAPHPAESGSPVGEQTRVTVEAPDLCQRFTARVISGIKIGESPWWLKKRLETIGVRPISNVVDITNYVMFECGQPLHAYDLDKLAGRRLVVRTARRGETLTAINNKVYELTPQMLAICDAERPVGLGGVMGGLETEIGPRTRNVLIEAAQFDPVSIRHTARALGLHSPSSFRFERGLDPERTEWASRRCAQLVLELAGGKLHPGVVDVGERSSERSPIVLRLDQVARVLGITIPRGRVEEILDRLGLELMESSESTLTYRPPSWRRDLEREIDLIEEAARVYGYDHIPENRAVPLVSAHRGRRERVESEVRNALTGLGLDEAVTLTLVDDNLTHPAMQPGPTPATPIRVEHSSRKREVHLRQNLVPSLLAVRAYNEAHGNADAALFEIANVYLPRDGQPLPDEPVRLAMVTGHDYRGLKGVIEALLDRLHASKELEARPSRSGLFVEGRQAELWLGGERLGFLGEVDGSRLVGIELRGACAAAEIEFHLLEDRAELVPRYQPLPPFPAMARDLSLVVPLDVPWSELAGVVKHAAGPLLEDLTYLDTFRGGSVPEGSQSVHFGLRFRHSERTLTSEEVDEAIAGIVAACGQRFGATLRT